MHGRYCLEIETDKVRYELTIERNITVIQGNSGTGKTTLYDIFGRIVTQEKQGQDLGVYCNMPDRIDRLADDNYDWRNYLKDLHGKIIIIDEGYPFISNEKFSSYIQSCDNYFIFCLRSKYLKNYTYAVKSVFKFVSYEQNNKVYNMTLPYFDDEHSVIKPDVVITEDSKSGYLYFSSKLSCNVISGGGKDAIKNKLRNAEGSVCIIADGAAFGYALTNLIKSDNGRKASYILPESFEWLFLNTSLSLRYSRDWVKRPYDFCDSVEFLSWERFFTSKFKEVCLNLHRTYDKSGVSDIFNTPAVLSEVKKLLPDLDESVWR